MLTLSAIGCITALFVQYVVIKVDGKAPPEKKVEDDTLEVNRTRYYVKNLSLRPMPAVAGEEPRWKVGEEGYAVVYPELETLLHPNFASYFLHAIFLAICAIMGIYCKCALVVFLALLVVAWPISAIFGLSIYAMKPFDGMWCAMMAKSIIVNWLPTIPMLLMGIMNCSRTLRQAAGIWVYFAFWCNIFWTLLFPMPDLVMKANGLAGAVLCCSLIIRLFALCKAGVDTFEVKDNFIYGYGTSLSYLVCYTVWNALFVSDMAVGLSLQDILFWVLMVFYYYWSGKVADVEDYFAMARPIQLSVYIGVSDVIGMIPWFKAQKPIGLDMNRHPYFFYIAIMNFIFSWYVLYCDINWYLNPDELKKKGGKMKYKKDDPPCCLDDDADMESQGYSDYDDEEEEELVE